MAFVCDFCRGHLCCDHRRDADRIGLSTGPGGIEPNIVLPDANIETVAAEVSDAIFFNQGQVCTAGSWLYVHRDCYDQVIDGVADIARA